MFEFINLNLNKYDFLYETKTFFNPKNLEAKIIDTAIIIEEDNKPYTAYLIQISEILNEELLNQHEITKRFRFFKIINFLHNNCCDKY